MGLDEESFTSGEKLKDEEIKVDKAIDRQTQSKQDQQKQQQVHKVSIKNLEAWFGTKQALKNINLDVKEKTVTAFIGPSGCGKTTLIRCLNRMHEMTPGAKAKGQVIIDGIDIYDRNIDAVIIKRPTMSIYYNVAAGLKLNGIRDKQLMDYIVKESLEGAALWDEVKNELGKPGMGLSGGQQQRRRIKYKSYGTEPSNDVKRPI